MSGHHDQLLCGWPETLPADNIDDRCTTINKVLRSLAMPTFQLVNLRLMRCYCARTSKPSVSWTNPSCLCSPSSEIGSSPLRVARVTAGLAESNGSLPPGLWLTSPAGWLPRTGISSGTLRSVIEYGLPLPFCPGWCHLANKVEGWPSYLCVCVILYK